MSIILNNERLSVEIASPGEEPNTTRRFDRAGFVTQVTLDGIHKFCSREPDNLPHKSSGGYGLCCEYRLPEPAFACPLGGQFPKPGIGLMTKDLEGKFVFHHPYPCLPYEIEVETAPAKAAFHTLPNLCMGYALEQTKTVMLRENRWVMEMSLKNAGKQRLVFEEYCHNFVTIDKMPIGPEYMVHLPVLSLEGQKPKTGCALKGTEDGVGFVCYSNEPSLMDIEKEKLTGGAPFVWKLTHENAPASISESVSYMPARVTVWAIDHIISPEVICHFEVEPGESVSWSRTWTFAG